MLRSKKRIFLSQRKYVLDLLAKIEKLVAKPCTTLMIPNVHLTKDYGDFFDDPKRYSRIVGKFNYIIVTCSNIGFVVSIVS